MKKLAVEQTPSPGPPRQTTLSPNGGEGGSLNSDSPLVLMEGQGTGGRVILAGLSLTEEN